MNANPAALDAAVARDVAAALAEDLGPGDADDGEDQDDADNTAGAALVDAGAARLVPDSELTSDRLVSEVTAILGDDEQLATMRAAARDHAAGDAAALLADAVAAALQ